jgi:hypothetical protein
MTAVCEEQDEVQKERLLRHEVEHKNKLLELEVAQARERIKLLESSSAKGCEREGQMEVQARKTEMDLSEALRSNATLQARVASLQSQLDVSRSPEKLHPKASLNPKASLT